MKKLFATLFMLYATAIDGDSIKYNNIEMRLNGIDAPEYHQFCLDKDGVEYHCGDKSYKYLKKLLEKPVNCKSVDVDRYKRQIAVCDDVNAKMVKSGWALSYYSDTYKKEELFAKENKLGVWQGKFMRPDLYRRLF